MTSSTNISKWKRDGAPDDVRQLAVPDALDDEQVDADRRRNLPELDEQNEDDARNHTGSMPYCGNTG